MKSSKIFRRTILILVIVFIISALMLKKMNSKIKSIGQIFPAVELKILPNFPDNLLFVKQSFGRIKSNKMNTFNFDRGDYINFILHKNFISGSFINKNDTIGIITSSLLDKEILFLSGELQKAKAELLSISTGEKQSVIQEAKDQLKVNETRLADQKNIVDRMRELKKSDLVSDQEFESAENYLRVLEADVMVAKSNLQIVSTGEKPEIIRLGSKQVESFEKQLNFLYQQKKSYTILTPVGGNIHFTADSMMTISDNSTQYVLFPVKLSRMDEIKIGQKIDIELPDLHKVTTAKVIGIDTQTEIISGNQIFWVTGQLNDGSYPVGAIVKCNVNCDSEALYKTIIKMFQHIEIN